MVYALMSFALAFPTRNDQFRRVEWALQEGRDPSMLIIKFSEESGIYWSNNTLQGKIPEQWIPFLSIAEPRFSRDSSELLYRQRKYDPNQELADLRTYVQLRTVDVEAVAKLLEDDHRVQHLYLAYDAVKPPIDIPPETPDYTGYQGYLGAAPLGLDSDYARFWPNGDGTGIRVADLEYSWDSDHEDLAHGPQEFSWGWDSVEYAFHGNGVLGELIGGDNGYGVRGMSLGIEMFMISPFFDSQTYNVADAIENSTVVLSAGDVLLIEQQAFDFDNYCPVEIAPDVFDAITHVVAQGIVVVEAGGNGGQDLDANYWNGWFQRDLQDSGAIIVGGGTPEGMGAPARSWVPGGSSYGSRVDVQAWYLNIYTAGGDGMADLFYPDWDHRQAYTAVFNGTSGASPMITAVVAIANALHLERTGTVWDPLELREAIKYTGLPQPKDDPYHIGPQPDLRRFLWTWAIR